MPPRSSEPRRLEILLLGVRPKSNANTIVDHLQAFRRYSRHRIHFLQNVTAVHGTFGGRLPTLPKSLDLAAFDALVIHYTNYLPSDECFDRLARERIADFRGLKVLFLQDEYRQVDPISARARELGVDVLFTCVPEPEIDKVYPAARLPRVTKVPTLTGFVPEDLVKRDVPPLSLRPVDVGYRARRVPLWLGELGQEKWEIAPKFEAATRGESLALDVSCEEKDRLYGEAWIAFLASCKATLGVESGASVFDFTGDIERSVEHYVAERPQAPFREVQHKFLREHEGRISLNQISPRCFEAAALRTAMILYEGRYSGILEPGRHYIPLRKDFGNIAEVIGALRDTAALQRMVDRAHEEIARDPRYSYRRFIETFDALVEAEVDARGKRPRSPGSRGRTATWHPSHRLKWFALRAFRPVPGALHRLYVLLVPGALRERLRPLLRRYLA
jgi:hypothetical protein